MEVLGRTVEERRLNSPSYYSLAVGKLEIHDKAALTRRLGLQEVRTSSLAHTYYSDKGAPAPAHPRMRGQEAGHNHSCRGSAFLTAPLSSINTQR